MGKIILNRPYDTDVLDSEVVTTNIDQKLKKAINNLKGNFYNLETGQVDYPSMYGSEAFEDYQKITRKLKFFDLSTLKTREAKLAFWINIYNSLVVDGIVQLQIKNTVREVSNFFEDISYNIGDFNFSLDDIEHGILRKNIKKHFFARTPFGRSDKRADLIMERLDPRIHFCLVCGSKSCPPIGTYQEEKIDSLMDLAAESFINGADFILDKAKNKVTISKIFKWYKNDFGTKIDLINFLAKYRKSTEDKLFLQENANKISISYLDYDWNLNH